MKTSEQSTDAVGVQAPSAPPSAADRLKGAALYPLPHHAISRLVNAATRWRLAWWKNFLIRRFVDHFGVDMAEAWESDAAAYRDFNGFFTRALRPGARPLPTDPAAVVCPADGTISAIGALDGQTLVQAKERKFSLTALLGGDPETAALFSGGSFATIYLSPRDYHRVHMPTDGHLRAMLHIPGRLFSVAPHTVRTIPNLFARNERVVTLFDAETGPMAVVLVGAICVASIETVWAGVVTPPRGRTVRRWNYAGEQAIRLRRGEELGRFNMGSTAIVLFGPDQIQWHANLRCEQPVRMGEQLGRALRAAGARAS